MSAIAQTERPYSETQEARWEVSAWKPVAAGIAVLVLPIIFLMLIVGGILFWMPHIALPGIAHATDQSQSQIADNGLGTMRKMVGDNAAWSAAITKEYERLHGTSLVCAPQSAVK